MDNIKIILDLCAQIMSIEITLYGYSFNLFSVLAFSLAGSLLLYILFKILS